MPALPCAAGSCRVPVPSPTRGPVGPSSRPPAPGEVLRLLPPTPQIFTRLGKCYTFNSGQPGTELLTTLQGGAGNGLELMLNIQQEEYLPVWGDTGECWGGVGGRGRRSDPA